MDKQSPVDQLVERLRAMKPYLESRYHVDEIAVFGSFASGKNEPESDTDILVSFQEPPTLLGFVELENHFATSSASRSISSCEKPSSRELRSGS